MNRLRADFKMIFIAFVVAAITSSVPAVAGQVVDFARRAGKVDGFSATAFDGRRDREVLVATNRRGFLPNGIIEKVRDADRLDGQDWTYFEPRVACPLGEMIAHAFIFGHGPVGEYEATSRGSRCEGDGIKFRHVSVGTYIVWFPGLIRHPCDVIGISIPPSLLVSAMGEVPLSTAYRTIAEGECGSPFESIDLAFEVRFTDAEGIPKDSDFTIAVMSKGRCCG